MTNEEQDAAESRMVEEALALVRDYGAVAATDLPGREARLRRIETAFRALVGERRRQEAEHGQTELLARLNKVNALLALAEAEAAKLRQAIIAHRSQKADDRCIEDDDRLYEALGDGIKCDRRVGDKLDMFHNCIQFIQNRCEGGGWLSYVELEAENARLRARLGELCAEAPNEEKEIA